MRVCLHWDGVFFRELAFCLAGNGGCAIRRTYTVIAIARWVAPFFGSSSRVDSTGLILEARSTLFFESVAYGKAALSVPRYFRGLEGCRCPFEGTRLALRTCATAEEMLERKEKRKGSKNASTRSRERTNVSGDDIPIK